MFNHPTRAAESETSPLSELTISRRDALTLVTGTLFTAGMVGCSNSIAPRSRQADLRIAELEDSVNDYLYREMVLPRVEEWGSNWQRELDWDIMTRNYPYRFTPRDSFDPGVTARQIDILFCSRATGLNMIKADFLSKAEEHSFIFVPAIEAWIDDTQSASTDSTGADPYLRTALLALYPEVQLFHTHPTETLQQQYREGKRGKHFLITGALPTAGDFISHIQQHQNDSGRMVSNVISHFGVCSYEFTEACIQHRGLASVVSGEVQGVNPDEDPVREILRLAPLYAGDHTYITRIELDEGRKVPGFKLKFEPFLKSPGS